jgi:hypothetical protein
MARPGKQMASFRATVAEVDRCQDSFAHFCGHCSLLSGADELGGGWLPFRLWERQRQAADTLQQNRLVVALKARQLGMSWLASAFALWHVLLHPVATVLLFSRRDDEAVDLLKNRVRGMYDRLPRWLQATKPFVVDNDHEWRLASGSRCLAFPSTAGDSYTGTLAVIDEADLLPDLGKLLRSVKPTIDGGGRLVLLSRPDKSKPESPFKRIYRAARAGSNGWSPLFLPWDAHPERDQAWYEAQRRDVLARTGSLDDLHEQYPATEAEALAPRSLDKRIPSDWLQRCYRGGESFLSQPKGCPAIPGLEVYRAPEATHRYVLGADPAEGNPTSDDSAAVVLDVETGEEVAGLCGKFQPDPFADYAAALARWYNRAAVMVERNNHGHAVLSRLRLRGTRRLCYPRDGKEGWNTTALSKAELFDRCAESVREGEVVIRSLATFTQLASIDGSTLRAPEGEHDDRAIAFALANAARPQARSGPVEEPSEDNRNAAQRLPEGVFGRTPEGGW